MTFHPPLHPRRPQRARLDRSTPPAFPGPATFAWLPMLRDVWRADIAVIGVSFDAGISYRSGAVSVQQQSGRPPGW